MQSNSPPTSFSYATIDAFAERLQVHKNTVRHWLKKGLPHVKAGRTVRIVLERADTWLASGGAETPVRSKRAKRTPITTS
jgi:excisionase family DNA binding protein